MGRERTILTVIGVGGIAAMIAGWFAARDAVPGDWRAYVFSEPRAWAFAIGLLPTAVRQIPSDRTKAFIDDLVFTIHRKLYAFAGTRGVILVSMLATYVLTVILAYPYAGTTTPVTATWLPDFAIMVWFAAQVSLFCQETVRQQQYQAVGAVDTRELWSHFIEGYGTCRVVLATRASSLFHSGRSLGESGANVLQMLMQRQQILLEMVGSPNKVRAISTQRLAEELDHSGAQGALALAHPTIIVGGPVANPATAAFLNELSSHFGAEDRHDVPMWRVGPIKDEDKSAHRFSFVQITPYDWERGLYLDDKSYSLTTSKDTSCGLVYVTRRSGQPLCVIAGFDTSATINIAENILRKPKDCLMNWARHSTESIVTEVWMMIQAGHVSVEKVRKYAPK